MKKPIHVLIAEDDKDQAWSLKTFLESRKEVKFTTETAQTVASALLRLEMRSKVIDIVIVDLGMPDASGPGVVEKVREHAPGVPIFVYTGTDDPQVLTQATIAGANGVAVKPADPAHLVKTLQWLVIDKRDRDERDKVRLVLKEAAAAMKEWVDSQQSE